MPHDMIDNRDVKLIDELAPYHAENASKQRHEGRVCITHHEPEEVSDN